jgi:branched-chain amino acid transport system ATP-binding protein
VKLMARDLEQHFRGIIAVDGVSLEVGEGEVVALIGPNGAGKSTVFALLTGRQRPHYGQIRLDDVDLTRASQRTRVRAGIAGTFQLPRVFRSCTVAEVLTVSAAYGRHGGAASSRDVALNVCEEMSLTPDARVAELNLHGLRLLEVARALATQPHVLLLDEISTGLDADQRGEVVRAISRVAAEGTGVLVIEHSMSFVRSVASRAVVLCLGKVLEQGSVEKVLASEAVIAAYLGSA